MMQQFNMNQYNRVDAANRRRVEHTTKRHPAVANGIWLSRRLNSADGASKVDNVDTVSPIFHGYKVTRRLQKTGPSIPPMGREVLEKLMFKETGQTKDVYVKVPPFGAGKFVEGRVWDPASGKYITLEDNAGDVGGRSPGLKGLGRAQNQVCDEYVVHLDWGNDAQGKDLKLANQRKYESGILHVSPDQVQFHVPGKPKMLREEKIKRGGDALSSADELWKKEWQTCPPPGEKTYLAYVFEAVKQYQLGIDILHGLTTKSKFPAQGALKWGEPYVTTRNKLLSKINLHLATCANILGKDNIEKASQISIFACKEVIEKYCKPRDANEKKLFKAFRDIEMHHRSLKAKSKKSSASKPDDGGRESGNENVDNVKELLKLLQGFVNDVTKYDAAGKDYSKLLEKINESNIAELIAYVSKVPSCNIESSLARLQHLDDARLQKALAIVERNDTGDIKMAKSELSSLWAVKGSLLYNEKRVELLKQLRVNIKNRLQRDKKEKMKLSKKLRKATKKGKRFGDDTRGKESKTAVSQNASSMQNVLPPTILGGVGASSAQGNNGTNNVSDTQNFSKPRRQKNTKKTGSSKGKKGKKKAKTKEWRFEDYIGYGAVAVGIAALASIVILKSGTRQ